ncbi:hypothetical protein SO802_022686 [Lithocarpus litseifolius]|uniref:Uncharacterized protein n=1 Tax=Lithocarpus litseifolius TaxID=425828 RepID=A0AAW2C5K6_9ROSI
MDQGDFLRLTKSMVDFVQAKTKLAVSPIHWPPFLSTRQLGFIVVATLVWIPFAIKKIMKSKTLLHDPKLWLAGSVFIYFFSVFDAMHNIIWKMPMFLADWNDPNKLVFFYQGSGMQLGAEGFWEIFLLWLMDF